MEIHDPKRRQAPRFGGQYVFIVQVTVKFEWLPCMFVTRAWTQAWTRAEGVDLAVSLRTYWESYIQLLQSHFPVPAFMLRARRSINRRLRSIHTESESVEFQFRRAEQSSDSSWS